MRIVSEPAKVTVGLKGVAVMVVGENDTALALGSGTVLPHTGTVFVSVREADRDEILGPVRDIVDLGFKIVATRGTTPIYVRDVGRVVVSAEPRFGAVTRDGRGETISAVVQMLKGSNGREVVDRVVLRLAEIEQILPRGVRMEIAAGAQVG